MMAMVNDRTGQDMSGLNKYVVEVNPKHQIIVDLNLLREENAPLAEKVARQVRLPHSQSIA
jgi:hypothetical protein